MRDAASYEHATRLVAKRHNVKLPAYGPAWSGALGLQQSPVPVSRLL